MELTLQIEKEQERYSIMRKEVEHYKRSYMNYRKEL